jgi:hypothetical protein
MSENLSSRLAQRLTLSCEMGLRRFQGAMQEMLRFTFHGTKRTSKTFQEKKRHNSKNKTFLSLNMIPYSQRKWWFVSSTN